MHTKPFLRVGLSVGIVAFSVGVLVTPQAAHAGFKWVPPEDASQVTSSSTAPVRTTTAATAASTPTPDLLPQIIEAPNVAPASAAASSTIPASSLASSAAPSDLIISNDAPSKTAAPVFEPPLPPSSHALVPPPSAMQEAPSLSSDSENKPVLGFANNVPLSVALHQVLPSSYTFAVAQDVSLGTIVSWRGGAGWHDVLKAMLLPAGLTSKEDGQTIQIVSAKGSSSSDEADLTPPSSMNVAPPVIEDSPAPALAPVASSKMSKLSAKAATARANEAQLAAAAEASEAPASSPVQTLRAPVGVQASAAPLALAPVALAQPTALPAPTLQAPVSLDANSKPLPLLPPATKNAAPKASTTVGYLVPPTGPASAPSNDIIGAPVSSGANASIEAVDAWVAEKGQTLHEVLQKWCTRAHVELYWQSEYDYPLQASISLSGGFEDAVRAVLFGFEGARPQPVGQLHKNPAADQTVLVIQVRGNEYSN